MIRFACSALLLSAQMILFVNAFPFSSMTIKECIAVLIPTPMRFLHQMLLSSRRLLHSQSQHLKYVQGSAQPMLAGGE